jgi:hypothetical protein
MGFGYEQPVGDVACAYISQGHMERGHLAIGGYHGTTLFDYLIGSYLFLLITPSLRRR